jgi:hypothetical protein
MYTYIYIYREMYDDIESEEDNSEDDGNKKKTNGKEKRGSEIRYLYIFINAYVYNIHECK